MKKPGSKPSPAKGARASKPRYPTAHTGSRAQARPDGGKASPAPRPDKARPSGPPRATPAPRPSAPPDLAVVSDVAVLPKGTVRVRLARGKSKPFWIGHPWVFSGAIAEVTPPAGVLGAPCIVEDERGQALGAGFYSPDAPIAVRIHWHRRATELPFAPPALPVLLRERLTAAIALRAALGFPSAETDLFRLVNAEGDGLPGLIIDRLGTAVSVQFGSRLMLEQRDIIRNLLTELLAPSHLVFSVTDTASRFESIPVMHEVEPEGASPLLVARERGVRYPLDLTSTQKTGFYCDQRENRARFAALCDGKTVLDAYCHLGGFGLNAALAGATRVTQVDTSTPALNAAREAAQLNGVDAVIETLNDDVINFLKDSQALGRTWDRIVIDPPKFAQGRGHLDDALQKYARLNTLAMAVLAPGGLLLTNSCSRHVSEDAFGRMLTESGHRLRRSVRVLECWGQPTDHPTVSVAPEGRYLKSWLIAME